MKKRILRILEGRSGHVVKGLRPSITKRWLRGSEAIVKLRATYLSGDLEDDWALHVREEQTRLQPPGLWRPRAASA